MHACTYCINYNNFYYTHSVTLSIYSKLNPRLTEADQFEIIKIVTDSIIPATMLSPNTKRKEITVVTTSTHHTKHTSHTTHYTQST